MLEISGLRTPWIGPIDLSVGPGECVCILGPSGSGKSLLLRAIADLDPNSGEVRLNGQSRDQQPAYQWRKLAGLVPAESGWWADQVCDHFSAHPDPGPLLKEIGLDQALDWDVSRLSTGERHRLAIVRALQNAPQALLLDEPTAGLDPEMTSRLEDIFKRECAKGVPMLLVTHDPQQAKRLSTRSFKMENGKLAPLGATQ